MDNFYKELKKYGKVRLNESLKKHTTFKIGGPAKYFVEVTDLINLRDLVKFLQGGGLDYFILGGGSNLLFSDKGFFGVVIKVINREVKVENDTIIASAGAILGVVVNTATQNSLSGLEWALGIPGTIGGAVFGNAGAMGENISNNVEKIAVWLDGEETELTKEECGFGYRHSYLGEMGAVILKVYLKLQKGDVSEIIKKVNANLSVRQEKLPSEPSAGSFFKNIKLADYPGDKSQLPEIYIERKMVPAAWLIDQCGLLDFRIGDAGISYKHGNFLVNYGQATAEDVIAVVDEVSKKVYDSFGIELEPEVRIIV
jgi:UDP-N-acetylmuramate dehydrogenase